MSLRTVIASTVVGVWLALPPTCFAATHALLIGVSGYPTLPIQHRLQGPANDVRLLRATLQRAGVPAGHIEVLADSVPGSLSLPTRSAILRSMEQLNLRTSAGDWVVLYFSGHGSQQPQTARPGVYVEPDGLDEIFLPYDVGIWDSDRKLVSGAIIDDEIGESISKLTRRQVNVWAIFDTCHAGDMAKGVSRTEDGPVARFVPPSALGVPAGHLTLGAARKAATASFSGVKAMVPPGQQQVIAQAPQHRPQTGRLVAFYASHPDEPAAEESLAVPAELAKGSGNAEPRRYFGLFTYLIADALRSPQTSLRQLSEKVTEHYKRRPYPTPLFEGGGIDKSPDFFPLRP